MIKFWNLLGGGSREDKSEQSFFFPAIDYDSHPQYADLAKKVTDKKRHEALAKFLPIFQDSLAQQALVSKYLGSVDAPAVEWSGEEKSLAAEGILALKMTAKQRTDLLQATEKFVEPLMERRRACDPAALGVGAASMDTCNSKNPDEVFDFFDRLLRDTGILPMCERVRGHGLRLRFVALQINESEDRAIVNSCRFEDGTFAKTRYMHMDTSVGSMKVIIYRTERVDTGNGAFRYIPGSHAVLTPLEQAIRKASDRAGFDSLNKKSRETLMCLPRDYRQKANMGNDLAHHPESEAALCQAERILTSDEGDLLVFNPDGIHRGNLFEAQGVQRQILQVLMAPKLD